jgi:hypothetical protein
MVITESIGKVLLTIRVEKVHFDHYFLQSMTDFLADFRYE